MRFISLKEQCKKLSDPIINNLLQNIELSKGQSFNIPKKIKLNRLHDLSKRRSVTSSNEIEGIRVESSKEDLIFLDDSKLETIEEYSLYGYNKALEMVFSSYKYQSLTESFIKDLHFTMYKSYNPSFGGHYKVEQNYIREFDNKGNLVRTIFIPAKPEDVTDYMGNLIYQFNDAINDPLINRLILICVFILDFLCIHPFFDGNGRMSRLLTTFLLLKYGYDVDYYYSISYTILNTLDEYYNNLEKSSLSLHGGNNNYFYFTQYLLNVISETYRKLNYIIDINSSNDVLDNKVKRIIDETYHPITKAELEELLINYSRTSIELSLSNLVKNNQIILLNKGKYAKYYKR